MPDKSGFAVWLTGLPASGKSSLARALSDALAERGVRVQVLDSDEMREVLTPEPTFSQAERDWFYATMSYIGRLLTQNGVNVAFAATANRRRHRDQARQAIPRFVEVYVRCSLETCMARDEKGIYARVLAGEATTVPGLQVPYEPPEDSALSIDTEQQTPSEGARQIVAHLEGLSFLKPRAPAGSVDGFRPPLGAERGFGPDSALEFAGPDRGKLTCRL